MPLGSRLAAVAPVAVGDDQKPYNVQRRTRQETGVQKKTLISEGNAKRRRKVESGSRMEKMQS